MYNENMFTPHYTLTTRLVSLLTAIAEAKAVIEHAKLLPKQELRLRRQALIRMTHASTGIEGNALNIRQVEAVAERKKIDASARDVYEVENYLKALRYITKLVEEKRPITESAILAVHRLVTDKTLPKEQSGHYRNGPVYVVRRRAGMPQEVLYTAPSADRAAPLIKELVAWIEKSRKEGVHPVVVAAIAHAEIAAIHPFVDGNGRTARAVATLILYGRGYDFRRLFALEDYYNDERPKYYAAINMGENYEKRRTDLTPWLEYFTKGFKEEIDDVKAKVIALSKMKVGGGVQSQVYLDKNQSAVLDFLSQVGTITVRDVMDILECPKRTAQLHLQKLKKLEIIVQTGKGPAAAYILVR
jgi:Fic family protein